MNNDRIAAAEAKLMEATSELERINAVADLRNSKREAGIDCCTFCGTTLHRSSFFGTIAATCSSCREKLK